MVCYNIPMFENPFKYSRLQPNRLDFKGMKKIRTDSAEDAEALRRFYENTGRSDEHEKMLGRELTPPLPEAYLKILKRIDTDLLEQTMKKIETTFEPPFPHNIKPNDVLNRVELDNLGDALVIAAHDQNFDPTGAMAIENTLADNQILEPEDIELLKKSIKDFSKYI